VKPARWRARLRWLHRWLGLGLGLLFALIGLSGSLLALQPEILRLQHPDWPAVVASNEALAAALDRIAHSAAADEITAIDLPTERLPVWQAYTAQDRRHYFDAQSGEWLLTRDVRNDWLLWLRDLHTHLLAGEIGEQALGIAGLCLLLLLASGLYLWWPRWHLLRSSLRWHLKPTVVRWLSWHRSSGAMVFAGLLTLGLTGVAMIYGSPVRTSLRWMAGEGAEVTAPASLPSRHAPIQWQAILHAAQLAMPEAELRRVAFPHADNAWVVIRARQPAEWHPNGRSVIWIDPYDGPRRENARRDDAGLGFTTGRSDLPRSRRFRGRRDLARQRPRAWYRSGVPVGHRCHALVDQAATSPDPQREPSRTAASLTDSVVTEGCDVATQ
jgi:uncharacterized iron-regulated membrane protein